jgi:hypothetical protein
MRILNLQGIFTAEIPAGNLLWVDAVNGIDTAGARGRLANPFRTLTAAKNAAKAATFDQSGNVTAPGDTIVVLPGIYNEKNLLKHGVNWHFMNGAIVRYEGTAPGGIFDTSELYGSNSSVTSSITGHGVFEMTSALSGSLLYVDQSDCRLRIEGHSMSSFAWCILTGTDVEDVALAINLTGDIIGNVAGALYVRSAGVTCAVRANKMHSGADYCIWVTGGAVEVEAAAVDTEGETAVCVHGGAITLRTLKIGSLFNPVLVARQAGGEVRIVGARIIPGSTYPAVWLEEGESLDLKLMHCVLVVTQSDYSIDGYLNGAAKQVVQCQGQCMANEPVNTSTIEVVGLLEVVAGIT